jgi:hypothetical protein
MERPQMIEPIARIRISLQETSPKIWRRLDVPLSTSLLALHDIIQIAMGWTDSHLFAFHVGDRQYGVPHPEYDMGGPRVFHAKSMHLKTLVGRGIDRFVYEYDFGDSWRHDILIEECMDGLPDRDYPFFIGGEGRCPPEDVGGISGFEEFLEAVRKPRHPEHRRMLAWYGRPYDPADIDERRIRRLIEDMAARRRGPLMSHRKGGRTASP